MTVYYNEIEPYCVQWLRNLMDAELIPRGDIDTRSIEDVVPNELKGYTQAHFFAGLGGWPYALQLAGWGTRPVWTGSCPCQPFSSAGKGAGFADERHLWPAWQHLIAQCRPSEIFGEQVSSKGAKAWIDLVQADLENMDYAFGCIPFAAAGFKSPDIRERAYWCATYSNCKGLSRGDWNGESGTSKVPSAWSELARVHAESRWSSWVSESGAGPLIDGISGRVGQVRAYGNAIKPFIAAEFIMAYCEAMGLTSSESSESPPAVHSL